ncbi:Lanthionine synthetase C family protein [Streptococcus pneumoniae]|nr:Lanthionine synthetase C family protein [Streptococcus pneumoniae]
MKTIYTKCKEKSLHYDIDVTYFEQWLGLKSSLPDKVVIENLVELFGSEYQANESIKELYLQEKGQIEIYDSLDNRLWDDFNDFSRVFSRDNNQIIEFLKNAKEQKQLTIENIAWPFIFYSLYKEKEVIKKLQPCHIDTFVELITKGVLNIAIKNHILDMNRHEKYSYYREESTYTEFIKNEILNFDFYDRFYISNPLLLSRCFSKTIDLITYFKEVINNLSLDFDLRSISTLSFSEGDTHSGGKTVVKFTSGTRNYYYKPRNLFIEKVFYDVLDIFRVPHIDNSENRYYESYSIIAEVEYTPVGVDDEIKEYYYTLGQLQFVLYLLGGSDIHYENLIAYGNLPVIIDLETLFQINYDHIKCDNSVAKERLKNQSELLQNIGILDLYLPGEGEGMNVSALFGKESKSVVQKEIFKNINTLDLMVEKAYIDNISRQNIPFLKNGKTVEVGKFLDDFILGFVDISTSILSKKNELVSYLNRLPDNLVVRNVLRPTFAYVDFLFYSTHPVYSTSPVRYNKLLENLFGIEFSNKEINIAEIDDITHDDVLIFFSHIGRKSIYNSTGTDLGECWELTPLEKVVNRVEQLDVGQIEDLIVNLKISTPIGDDTTDFINILSKEYILNKLKNEGVFFNSPLLTATNKLIYSTLDTSIRCGVVGLWSYLIQQGAEFDVYAKNIEKFIEDDFMNYTNFVDLRYIFAYYLIKYTKFNEDDALKNISNIVGKNKTIYKELEEEIKTYDKIVTDNEYYSAISQFESEILDSISILKGRMFNGA